MKSSLEKIKDANKKCSELLETRLKTIDSFDSEENENNGRPKRKSMEKGKNTILIKECIFCKKNKYKNRVLEKLMQCLEFHAVDSIKKVTTAKNDFMMLSLLS